MVKRGFGFLVMGQMLLMTCMLAGALADKWQMETSHKLAQRLQSPLVSESRSCPATRFDLDTAVVRFYQHRVYALAWVDRYGLLPEGAMALAAVKRADSMGLLHADYHNPLLDDLLGGYGFQRAYDRHTKRWCSQRFSNRIRSWGMAPGVLGELLQPLGGHDLVAHVLDRFHGDYENGEGAPWQHAFRAKLASCSAKTFSCSSGSWKASATRVM